MRFRSEVVAQLHTYVSVHVAVAKSEALDQSFWREVASQDLSMLFFGFLAGTQLWNV